MPTVPSICNIVSWGRVLIAVLQATLHRRDLVILNEARDRFKLLASRRPAVRPGNKPMDVKREFGIEVADAGHDPGLVAAEGSRIEPRIGLEIEGPHGMRVLERAGTNGGLAVSDVRTKRRQDREDHGDAAKSTFRKHRYSPFNAWV
jgi:hypothetical protein